MPHQPCLPTVLATTLAAILANPTRAQLNVGDIGVTGFSTSAFGVMTTNGPPVAGYTTPGFQGSGVATSQAILVDHTPSSFLIGGFGFVGRATILGPGSVAYTLITNNVGVVAQMSWHHSGLVVFADSGTDQIRVLEPVTGTIFDLAAGPQPWGTSLSAAALHPVTGDVIAGGDGAIYALASGSTVAVPIVLGLGGFVSGIQFDPVTGDIVATVLTVNRLIRVPAPGVVLDIAPPFSIPGPNALDVDQNGDFIAGGGTGQVYRVPRAGGSPTLLASNTSPPNAVNGLCVVGAGGYAMPFGAACNGANGPASLSATGPFLVGSTVVTRSTNHAPDSPGLLILGLSNTSSGLVPLPLLLDPILGTAGCSLHVSFDLTVGSISSPGNPSDLTFAFALTPIFAGWDFYLQHACLEPVPGGLSTSNGLAFRVP